MAIDLSKKTEKLKVSLAKKKIQSIKMQVGSVVDRSGSMDHLYRNGTVQEYIERLMPLGLKFDDNGQIDNWAFHTSSYQTGPITLENLEGFVKKNIERISSGGTSFSPVLEEIERYYFGTEPTIQNKRIVTVTDTPKKGFLGKLFGGSTPEESVTYEPVTIPGIPPISDSTDPIYLIFQTDGENGDRRETDSVLARLEKKRIYIQFVGIGTDTDFQFIQDMGDKYSNVGFMHIKDLKNTTDEDIYDLLINDELKTFLKSKFPSNIVEG